MRVAYLITAGQGHVLPKTSMRVQRGRLVLQLPRNYAALSSDRVFNRLRQLARLIGREAAIDA
jgi:exopolyphosphatase/guanosine-5'-triphosphate,3'-diphosphate pyrophosphatase